MSVTDQGTVGEVAVVVADRDSLEDVLDRLWLLAGRTVRLTIPVGTSLFLTASEFRVLHEVAVRREVALTLETEDPLRIQLAGLFGLPAVRLGGPPGPRSLPGPANDNRSGNAGPRLVPSPAAENGHQGHPSPGHPLPDLPPPADDDADRGPVRDDSQATPPRPPASADDGPRFREPGQSFTVRTVDGRPPLETPARAPVPLPPPPPAVRPAPLPVVAPAAVPGIGAPERRSAPASDGTAPTIPNSRPGTGRFDELRAAAERRTARERGGWNRRVGLAIAAGAAIALVLAALALFVVLPKATVTLGLQQQTLIAELPVRVLPTGDAAEAGVLTVPGQAGTVEVSYEATAETTGIARIGEAAAKGTVQLVNPTDEPVTIAAGAVGVGDAGAEVRFAAEVTVPAAEDGTAGQAEVAAEMVAAGSTGNLDVGELSGRLDSGVYFSNRLAPFAGGTDREGRGVAQADLEALTARFDGELPALAEARFAESLPPGTSVVAGSLSYGEPTLVFDRAAGELGDSVTLTATVQVQGVTYRPEDVMVAADPALRAALQEQVPEGYDLDPQAITFAQQESAAAGGAEGATVVVTASGRAVHRFGEEERAALGERLEGADADEAAEVLRAVPAIDRFEVDYFPGVIGERMPRQADRIEIVLAD